MVCVIRQNIHVININKYIKVFIQKCSSIPYNVYMKQFRRGAGIPFVFNSIRITKGITCDRMPVYSARGAYFWYLIFRLIAFQTGFYTSELWTLGTGHLIRCSGYDWLVQICLSCVTARQLMHPWWLPAPDWSWGLLNWSPNANYSGCYIYLVHACSSCSNVLLKLRCRHIILFQ